MNNKLQGFAKTNIKEGLAKLPESHVLFFKRMYANGNLGADINTIVDAMPADKLDCAMQQVQRSCEKQNKDVT